MRRLILWDIDGTLVSVGEVGAEVFDRAIEKVIGTAPPDRILMSGKTDPQIVGEYLDMLEIADHERHLEEILGQLASELATEGERIRAQGRVLPGVVEVLDRLSSVTGVRQTVLTGNIAANAFVKLAAFGLDQLLDLEIGAFGSDHHDRRELVPVALGRLARRWGETIEPHDVWVVGDTANDLACARAGRARCLLVATGRSQLHELGVLGADEAREDLTEVDAVVELLLG